MLDYVAICIKSSIEKISLYRGLDFIRGENKDYSRYRDLLFFNVLSGVRLVCK